MSSTARVTIRIKPYHWSDFVHDACFVLYAAIILSNALFKRFFKRSIPQAYHQVRDATVRVSSKIDEIGKNILLVMIVIMVGALGLAFTLVYPYVVIMGFLGKL